MNKKITGLVLVLIGISMSATQAQYFNGVSTSNYMTQSAAFINPAEMSTSASKYSLDIAGIQGIVSMNKGLISASELVSNGTLKFDNSVSGDYKMAMKFEMRPIGIGFKVKNFNIALTSRIRSNINVGTEDGNLLDLLLNGTIPSNLNSFQVDKTYILGSVIGDIGISASAPIMSTSDMKLYLGGSLRSYTGAVHAGIDINNINITTNSTEDTVTVNNIDVLGYYSVPDIDVFEKISDFSSAYDALRSNAAGKGVGGDIGATLCLGSMNAPGDYKLKLGLSITDIGRIKYKQGREYGVQGSGEFTENTELDISNGDSFLVQLRDLGFDVQDGSIKEINYALPTSIQVSADYALKKNIYLNAHASVAMSSISSTSVPNPSFVTFTPRFQSRLADVMIPITYNFSQNDFQFGLAARFYFFYFGTQNLFGLFQEYPTTASAYAGISLGFGKGNQKKKDSEDR